MSFAWLSEANNLYAPICTGPCRYGGGGRSTFEVLREQQRQHFAIRERIQAERVASLTPAIMRAEMKSLGERIDRARTSYGESQS